MLKDVESSAAALYDGGWRAEDKVQLKREYGLSDEDANVLCKELEKLEPEIRTLRIATGMTQKAFAEYFNIPVRTIENWEGGKRNPPGYVVELIKYKLKKEMVGMLKLVEFNEGEKEVVVEGTVSEIRDYLMENTELWEWIWTDADGISQIDTERPDFESVEVLRDLEHELAKLDHGWWSLTVE